MDFNEAIQQHLAVKIANLEVTNSKLQVNLQHANALLKKAQEELTALKGSGTIGDETL